MTIREAQELIGTWHKETFPNCQTYQVFRKLKEEVNEVLNSVSEDDEAEELADVAIVILALCNRLNIDLEQQIAEKHAVNLTRKFNADGSRDK